MAFLVGIILGLAVSLMATLTGLDRERGFYPIVLIVSASCYDLFAVVGGGVETVIAEIVPFTLFLIVGLLGFKKNLWLVVAAFVGHGIFDLTHSRLIPDPGVPVWWPIFCLSYDITAALYLTWRLIRAPVRFELVLEAQGS